MRSRFLQQIIDSTPKEVDIYKRARKWADDMKRIARYEARRGIYHKRLVNMEVAFGNYKRDERYANACIFFGKERNYEQQEID